MTLAADGLPPLRDVIRRLGLSARKSLSQNFILDLNLTGRIARATGPLDGATVIEIGPGPGGLTRALLSEGAGAVIAIERDERCLPALDEIAAHWPGRLRVIQGDALETDYAALAAPHADVRIIANLPYAVATPLLLGWLKADPWPPWWRRMALMFQREVADRIVAAPGSKAYGRLSIAAQWRSQPHIAFTVPAQAFTPPPKVSSAVVSIAPTPEPAPVGASLEAVTAAAFGQRRKMLRSALKGIFPQVDAALSAAALDETARAEDVDVPGFLRLAAVLQAQRTR
ncbi:MAG: 16S rRNA (adenine(1518)-N(6)/adenine(1519)-N(6))-dimethyltransferase RsmA [Hyphomicrobiales bacterium]|nr:16S rRNA (adenine(1518)-N(6)/adenine(1519)-N(6))-dimethyltransferase RsmA [Hyphomicrobiales bacterium]